MASPQINVVFEKRGRKGTKTPQINVVFEKGTKNWKKNDLIAMNKATELFAMFDGGFIKSSIAFPHNVGNNKRTRRRTRINYNSRFYVCYNCDFSKDCNSVREAKLVKRLHTKKCKGK
jgi:hypothetical protein